MPDAYGYVGTLWLGTVLVGAQRRVTLALAGAGAAGWFALSRVFDGVARTTVPAWPTLVVLAFQAFALSVNLWAVRKSGSG